MTDERPIEVAVNSWVELTIQPGEPADRLFRALMPGDSIKINDRLCTVVAVAPTDDVWHMSLRYP